jgi:hypothetical protein
MVSSAASEKNRVYGPVVEADQADADEQAKLNVCIDENRLAERAYATKQNVASTRIAALIQDFMLAFWNEPRFREFEPASTKILHADERYTLRNISRGLVGAIGNL